MRGYGRGGATYVGELHGAGASWEADEVFGQALRCSEVGADGVTPVADGEGARATLNITGADYGASGEFTLGMVRRHQLTTHARGLARITHNQTICSLTDGRRAVFPRPRWPQYRPLRVPPHARQRPER